MIDGAELIASLEGRVMGGVLHNGGYIHVPQEEAEQILTLLKEQERIIKQYQKADGFLFAHGWKWEGR